MLNITKLRKSLMSFHQEILGGILFIGAPCIYEPSRA